MNQRRSIRLKGYDYTQPGAYFVTLVAFHRDGIFGEIVAEDGVCPEPKMNLSALGVIVRDEWLRSGQIRREIELFDDEFVVMPNHLHGIVRIIEKSDAAGVDAGGANRVGVDGIRPPMPGAHAMRPNVAPGGSAQLHRPPRSLGSFIGGFKASVTSRAQRELKMTGIWQRNYYEHIIRNEVEFNRIWKYIDANPSHWQEDSENPASHSISVDEGESWV